MLDQAVLDTVSGISPEELDDWYESLEDILHRYGPERLRELLVHLQERAYARGVMLPFTANTPYINTIHHSEQVKFPGDRQMERRINVRKEGLERFLYNLSREHSLVYGLLSLIIAVAAGYGASAAFRLFKS